MTRILMIEVDADGLTRQDLYCIVHALIIKKLVGDKLGPLEVPTTIPTGHLYRKASGKSSIRIVETEFDPDSGCTDEERSYRRFMRDR